MDKIKDSGSFDASSILAGTTKIQKSLTKKSQAQENKIRKVVKIETILV